MVAIVALDPDGPVRMIIGFSPSHATVIALLDRSSGSRMRPQSGARPAFWPDRLKSIPRRGVLCHAVGGPARTGACRHRHSAMARYDFRTPRLYVDAPLGSGAEVALDRDAANHLCNVLRLTRGDAVLLFNGRDGEWRGTLAEAGKRAALVRAEERGRPPPAAHDQQ
jgi:hypothetical protein